MSKPLFTAAIVEAQLEKQLEKIFTDPALMEKLDKLMLTKVRCFPARISSNDYELIQFFVTQGHLPSDIVQGWFTGQGYGMKQIRQYFETRGIALSTQGHSWSLSVAGATPAPPAEPAAVKPAPTYEYGVDTATGLSMR